MILKNYLLAFAVFILFTNCVNRINHSKKISDHTIEIPTVFSDTLQLKYDTICILNTFIKNSDCLCFKDDEYSIDSSTDTLNHLPCFKNVNFSQQIKIIYNNRIISEISPQQLIDKWFELAQFEKEERDGLVSWISSLEGKKNLIEIVFCTYYNTFIVGLFDYHGNLIWYGNEAKYGEYRIVTSNKDSLLYLYDVNYKKDIYTPIRNCQQL